MREHTHTHIYICCAKTEHFAKAQARHQTPVDMKPNTDYHRLIGSRNKWTQLSWVFEATRSRSPSLGTRWTADKFPHTDGAQVKYLPRGVGAPYSDSLSVAVHSVCWESARTRKNTAPVRLALKVASSSSCDQRNTHPTESMNERPIR